MLIVQLVEVEGVDTEFHPVDTWSVVSIYSHINLGLSFMVGFCCHYDNSG